MQWSAQENQHQIAEAGGRAIITSVLFIGIFHNIETDMHLLKIINECKSSAA